MAGFPGRNKRLRVVLATAMGLVSLVAALFLVAHSHPDADGARDRSSCQATRDRLALATPTGRPLFFGDSYVRSGYGDLVAHQLGWPEPALIALPGSGYVSDGVCHDMPLQALLSRVVKADPPIVVVAAGLNDENSPKRTVHRNARLVLGLLRSGLPEARIVVVGPVTPTEAEATEVARVDRALAGASAGSGVEYVSALDWLQPRVDFGADERHPTPAGYRKLALRLAAVLDDRAP